MLFSKAIELMKVKGFTLGNEEIRITHLQFADDILIFCETDIEEVMNIKRILRYFETMSGLKINYHKSTVSGHWGGRGDILVCP